MPRRTPESPPPTRAATGGPPPVERGELRAALGAALVLAVVTLLVFLPALDGQFVNWDDESYVLLNRDIQHFDLAMVRWALTAGHAYNWHPLTWISHAADWALFGPDPWGHHLVNVVLHALNTALLAIVLWAGTRRLLPALAVAALFGLHPAHVESVAWIAERKDLLSSVFWWLTTLAYIGYARRGGAGRYALVVAGLACGLASKPMVVTLPAVLLLLDIWPLKRFSRRAVLEKLPLLALSAASSVVTVVVQRAGGAVASTELISVGDRLQNAIHSYAAYLGKLFLPVDLVVFYPFREAGGAGRPGAVAFAALLVVAITAAAFALRRRLPPLLVGWLWYLGTLVPVIGLLQVGQQAMADRYTYVPAVGIFLAVVYGLDAACRNTSARRAFAGGTLAVLAVLALLTSRQIPVWRDSVSLWSHNLAAWDVPMVHLKLAQALNEAGRPDEAADHLRAMIAQRPGATEGLNSLGNHHFRKGEFGEATALYLRAIAADPDEAKGYALLGAALIQAGQLDEGRRRCQQALDRDPEELTALDSLGIALAKENDLDGAIATWKRSLAIDDTSVNAHRLLAQAYQRLGQREDAIRHYTRALELEPGDRATAQRLAELEGS